LFRLPILPDERPAQSTIKFTAIIREIVEKYDPINKFKGAIISDFIAVIITKK